MTLNEFRLSRAQDTSIDIEHASVRGETESLRIHFYNTQMNSTMTKMVRMSSDIALKQGITG